MKHLAAFPLLLVFIAVAGCRKPIAAPENIDPIYKEMKSDLTQTSGLLSANEKDLAKAKDAIAAAPMRTGQRQDAQDAYFELKKDHQLLIEKFRYLSVKVEKLRIADRKAYEKAFNDNNVWPDPAAYETYVIEKRLADAPKEWSPENRAKKDVPRAPAASEGEGSSE